MSEFELFNISDMLKEAISRLGYETPTMIQKKSIPPIMEGKDVMGESATGSGKTLAFGCGVLDKTVPGKGLQSLILSPTRELAEQVREALASISYGKGLNIISVYGGVSLNPQFEELKKAEVVIATPGRLMDHMRRGTVDLSGLRILVLDEADRMLDMGFIEDIEYIVSRCPRNRQTLLFSATMPEEIKRLSMKYMKEPVRVTATKQVDPDKMRQLYYDVPRNMKLSLLVHLITEEKKGLVMVFCNTRRTTEFVIKALREAGLDVTAIHGGYTQNKRALSLERFKDGRKAVLVCTDVASRGLHIDGVSHVYNYDIPKNPVDYVHRIGRTARAGEEGKVVNLLSEEDHDSFQAVLQGYRDFTIQKMQMPYVKKLAISKGPARRSNRPGSSIPGRGSSGSFGRRNFRSPGHPRHNPRHSQSSRRGFRKSHSRHSAGRAAPANAAHHAAHLS